MTTETSIDVMAELGILEPAEVAQLLKLRHSTVLDLSRRGVLVHGIDLSEAMVDRLHSRQGTQQIGVTIGDFATAYAGRKFRLAYLVYGTMGGEGQPQTQAAIVTRVVDYGMTPQEAINAPRWLHGRTWGASSNDTKFEGRIPANVNEELKKRGHPVKVVENYTDTMGHAGAILIDPATKVRYGATDPRGDGVAAGYCTRPPMTASFRIACNRPTKPTSAQCRRVQ